MKDSKFGLREWLRILFKWKIESLVWMNDWNFSLDERLRVWFEWMIENLV